MVPEVQRGSCRRKAHSQTRGRLPFRLGMERTNFPTPAKTRDTEMTWRERYDADELADRLREASASVTDLELLELSGLLSDAAAAIEELQACDNMG